MKLSLHFKEGESNQMVSEDPLDYSQSKFKQQSMAIYDQYQNNQEMMMMMMNKQKQKQNSL